MRDGPNGSPRRRDGASATALARGAKVLRRVLGFSAESSGFSTQRARKPRRVFFFAPVVTDDLNREFGRSLHVGAGSHKAFGLCRALRAGGAHPVIVSGWVPTRPSQFRQWISHRRVEGIAYALLFTIGEKSAKRMVTSLSYLFYAMCCVRRGDKVILYNYFPEYFLAILYLRIIGRPAMLDIEDAPMEGAPGFRELVARVCFKVLQPLCAEKFLTVSHELGARLQRGRFLPVYGVATYFSSGDGSAVKFSGDRVNILFGGSLMPSTGLELFQEAVRLLRRAHPQPPLHFFITGVFPREDMEAFAREIEATSRFRVTLQNGLTAAEYRSLALKMDMGLSLRLPSALIAQTTFPSKVIEYAAMGMLVCATAVSDIPLIFDADTGILLQSEDPQELAAALADAAAARSRSAFQAREGQRRILERFSSRAVGRELVEFLYG